MRRFAVLVLLLCGLAAGLFVRAESTGQPISLRDSSSAPSIADPKSVPSSGENERGFRLRLPRLTPVSQPVEEPTPTIADSRPSPELGYLKEIAQSLSIPVPPTDTSGDLSFKILNRLQRQEQFNGTVLTDESFADVKDAILSSKDKEAFAAYHAFIKKIAGKKVVIIDSSNDSNN